LSDNLFKAENLTKKFGELVAVNKLNFSLDHGEVLGLIGPNGAGKTTVFNCITGVYTPTDGRTILEGEDITGLQKWQVRRKGIARTFQTSRHLPELSLYDNIFVGALAEQDNKIINAVFRRKKFKNQVIKNMEKANELMSLFNEDMIDEGFTPASELSQIDRRRLEVVRALMMQSDLLLLDEPTAGMTETESMEFVNDISKIRERFPELGIVIIEHDMLFIKGVSDRVLVLNYGEKIAEGQYKQVAKNKQVKEAYLGE